jgi:2-hydroxy-6-oxonona-2,4-dienedioate hydrolase
MQVRFIDVDGILTRCLMAGNAASYPLLLLHGYGGTADIWMRNIDALGEDFFVVAPDMINCGFTDFVDTGGKPPQPQTVAHLRKLADQLQFGRCCAMGTSYGGLISALLHFDMPQRVEKLVLIGSGSCFNEDDKLVATFRRVLDAFGDVMIDATIAAVRASMVKQVFTPAAVPEEILPVMATAYARPGMRKYWEMGLHGLLDLEASRQWSVRHRLEQVAAETLVVWGRDDPGAIYESAVAAVKRMPRARMTSYSQCGHKPMLEHTASFNALIRDFAKNG